MTTEQTLSRQQIRFQQRTGEPDRYRRKDITNQTVTNRTKAMWRTERDARIAERKEAKRRLAVKP